MRKIILILLSAFVCFNFCLTTYANEDDYVAYVGETGFNSLQEAINSIDDGEVRLVKSVEESISIADGERIQLTLDGNVTLKNIIGKHTIENNGDLTIFAPNGTFVNDEDENEIVNHTDVLLNNGTVTIVSGSFVKNAVALTSVQSGDSLLQATGRTLGYVIENKGTMEIGLSENIGDNTLVNVITNSSYY